MGMETLLNSVYLDNYTNWIFDNPVKVIVEHDYNCPPVGSANLFTREDGLYADIILDNMPENYLELYPHISFSKNGRIINSIMLSYIENVDERVKTIDPKTE
jgi:hypothetical protein